MEKEIVIKSTQGLHASLAAKVVQTASKYTVDIELQYKDRIVDLKSILALMSLAIPYGENVRIIARGSRAQEAIKDIASILG
jgi:phosphocarrier protein HPr